MALKEVTIQTEQLDKLFSLLKAKGYTLIGPTLKDGVITYDTIDTPTDLPKGWQDEQAPGKYRLHKRKDNAYFGYNIGAKSFKDFLFPPRRKLFDVTYDGKPQVIAPIRKKKLALIGVRACEIQAILIQDKVFNTPPNHDPAYKQVREDSFIIGLNCHTTTSTCFCVSMNSGPEVTQGYDLVLSELIKDNSHEFICRAGSDKGMEIINQLNGAALSLQHKEQEKHMIAHTAKQMGKTLDTSHIKEKLYQAHDSKQWEAIAQKCLNCGNCTMACPTCFCSSDEHDSNLEQNQASVTRVWESCFTKDHSYIHDSVIRDSASSRYRQWMTHKLASWHDQFDTSGCVGCGRCITWCPVGIDLTKEATLLMKEQEDKSNEND